MSTLDTNAVPDTITKLMQLVKNKSDKVEFRKKSGKSDIWKYFSAIYYCNEEMKDSIACNNCKKVFKYLSKSGTSHLTRHYQQCTKTRKEESSQQKVTSMLKRKLSAEDKVALNKAAIRFIAKDLRPINIFEGQGFQVNLAVNLNTFVEILK